jgi:hypothetical protein
MQLAKGLLDGQKASAWESVGMAATAAAAIPAGAVTSLPVKSPFKSPASLTTAVTPNT